MMVQIDYIRTLQLSVTLLICCEVINPLDNMADFPAVQQHEIEISTELAELSLTRKGKNCVEVAKKVIAEIAEGKAKMALENLKTLQTCGKECSEHAEKLVKWLEKVQEYNQKQEEDIQQQIGEYEYQENEKQKEMNRAQHSLDGQYTILQQSQASLSTAKKELHDAERRLSKERSDAEDIQVGAVVLGAILGFLTGGLGAVGGGALGGGVGALINELTGEVDRAKHSVGRREDECSRAKSEIGKIEEKISNMKSQLKLLSSQKAALKNQRLEYNKKATELKEAVAFLQEANTFWLEFKKLSDYSVDRGTLLKRIVEKAESQAKLEFCNKHGTKLLVGTVLDVWGDMERMMAEEGSTQFVFAIEYQCTRYSQHCNNLPYVVKD